MTGEVSLDIISDPVCPWCFIGWRNLARALEARPDHRFAITWHPYELNPDMPDLGMDRQTYLETKFDGQSGAVKAYLPVVEAAEAAGVTLDLGRITRQPNTRRAHALIHWAGLEGRQTAMVQALFRAYFQEGRDIGEAHVLVDLAGQVGLDGAMILRLLEAGADLDEIGKRAAHATARGVTGVPCFVIANTYVVQGAQPPDFWMQVIDEIAAQNLA